MSIESRKQALKVMMDDILKEIESNHLQLNNALYLLKISIEHNQRHNIDDICEDITFLNKRIIALRQEYDAIASIV